MRKPEIGFIGLGNMGGPMALNLIKAGYPLCLHDVNPATYARLDGFSANTVDSPKEVAQRCEVIFASLPSVKASEAVWLGEDGVAEGARKGAILVELSTVNPELVKRVAARTAPRGIHFLDAGVSGGVKKAEKGALTIMAGGSKEAFERVRPLFETIGEKIYHVGDVGAGMVVKLINNAIAHINVVAYLECISVGLKAGVSMETLYQVISQGTGSSRQFETRFKNKVMTGDYLPGMKLELVYKDSELMLEMASRLEMPVFLTAVSHQVFETGRARGLGNLDYAALMRLWDEFRDSENLVGLNGEI